MIHRPTGKKTESRKQAHRVAEIQIYRKTDKDTYFADKQTDRGVERRIGYSERQTHDVISYMKVNPLINGRGG